MNEIAPVPLGTPLDKFCDICGQPDGAHYVYCIRIRNLEAITKSLDARIAFLEAMRKRTP